MNTLKSKSTGQPTSLPVPSTVLHSVQTPSRPELVSTPDGTRVTLLTRRTQTSTQSPDTGPTGRPSRTKMTLGSDPASVRRPRAPSRRPTTRRKKRRTEGLVPLVHLVLPRALQPDVRSNRAPLRRLPVVSLRQRSESRESGGPIPLGPVQD